MHAPRRETLPYVPTGHGFWAAAPSSQKKPVPHFQQSASLTPPERDCCPLNTTSAVWLLYVPAGHGVSAADSRGQYVPALQLIGLTVAFGQENPAGQLSVQPGCDWSSG